MATSELRFLRNLKPGIPLFLRINKPGGSWRRLEGISEPYFSKDVGNRVDEEFGKHKEQIENKYGRAIGKAIIEEGFHTSKNDAHSHASISYEDVASNHLSTRHVTEQRTEQQAMSDNN
ncbi:hypothetical protein GX50_06203 [[Emmonsia] crescens]|uniref:Uncharacterized protein n=1 Tax=[Emmonsia] crescens TaxID=73230 RepID=A0A2B7ZBT3_9EURO|nr:hypothetical protein GX50_06203 [Emmonsia crescens]